MKPKWAILRFMLATIPLLPLLLWIPEASKGHIRYLLLFFATFLPFYVLKWPKFLDEEGEGLAGAWGLRAICMCYSRPPPAAFSGRYLVAVGNEGYEAKVCVYAYYLLSPPKIEEELPPGGEPCSPEFHAYPRPQPPIFFAERSREVALVAWHGNRASAYPRGNAIIKTPKTLKPPRQDNTWTEYRLYTDWIMSATQLAYSLLDRAKPSPTKGIRIGLDEYGREYRLPPQHIGVFGSTGSGKSSTLALLAERLAKKGHKVWIIDSYGEYRLDGFQVLYTVPNPFTLKTPEEKADLLETASIVTFGPEKGIYSPIVRQVLLEALRMSDNINHIISQLEKRLKAGKDAPDILAASAAALRRLEPLRKIKWRKEIREIPDTTIFDISFLHPLAKILAVNSILEKAWETGHTFIIIDEASSFTRNFSQYYLAPPSLTKVLTLGRSREVFIALADQYADKLPQSLLSQLTKLWLRHLPPPPNSAPPHIRHMLPTLKVGEAVTDNGVLIKIDPPPKLKTKTAALLDKVTLRELEAYLHGTATEEIKIKLWTLGLTKGGKLTKLGKQIYYSLKHK